MVEPHAYHGPTPVKNHPFLTFSYYPVGTGISIFAKCFSGLSGGWMVGLGGMLLGVGLCVADDSLAPVVPGLYGQHPLDERQQGELLISELRCASCHEGMSDGHMKLAPELSNVGSRLTPDFIKRYISDPAAAHPGTTMPGMLGGESEEKREEVAEAITAYLLSLTGGSPEVQEALADADLRAGSELFHSTGCVACHSPRDEEGNEIGLEGAVPLSHLPGKYQAGELAEFLHAPLKVRPSGRMPDMKLTREEAAVLAAFLGGPAVAVELPAADATRIEAGRRAFQQYNCTACHQPEESVQQLDLAGPAVVGLNTAGGCLSENPGSAPNFHLSASQNAAIRKALEEPKKESTPTERINMHLTQMNCISCHVRDDFGGVRPGLEGYFKSTEESLGNESKIPPQLTLTGAKLRPEWMRQVLYDGEGVRPYMTTRMPLFGEKGLKGLADLFAEVDKMEEVELAPPGREEQPEMRNAAHFLLGDKGLNCIACHNYNGKESPGMKGLDIMTSFQRLQPSWFYHFMINPAAHRPGIIMPSYWPGGEAVQTETLDGDTDRQLRALWDYISLGRSARDPSGLQNLPSILEVTDEVMTYRGRSEVAGYRGIAVGFPEGISYAFNANNGAFSAIWKGKFVNVGWQGQGSGNFNPIGRSIQLAQDVAFFQLKDENEPWPLRPQTTKEEPVNPDPLYPKNVGYAFLGYSLDEAFIPTFRYRCGRVLINDKTVAIAQGESVVLRRGIRFSAPEAGKIWMRVLTGSIQKDTETVFKTDDIRLSIDPAKTVLRQAAEGGQELLIELSLPQGESTFAIDYEPLR